MTKSSRFEKPLFKSKKKTQTPFGSLEEENQNLSFKEIRRDKEHKQYRNYENALRSKNISRLLSYEEE